MLIGKTAAGARTGGHTSTDSTAHSCPASGGADVSYVSKCGSLGCPLGSQRLDVSP